MSDTNLAFSLDAMPEDIRGEPSLKDFKTVDALAKSYVHAVKKLGVPGERILTLEADGSAGPSIFERLGKPKDGKYTFPQDLKTPLPDGYKLKLNDFSNKHNLTQTQFEELLHFTDAETVAAIEANKTTQAQAREAALNKVKENFGASYDQTLNFAKNVPEMFGKGKLWEKFEAAGLTTDPEFLGLMGDIGRMAGEDTIVNGGGNQGFTMSPAQATAEINSLLADPEFMKKYTDKAVLGHKEAVARIWELRQHTQASA